MRVVASLFPALRGYTEGGARIIGQTVYRPTAIGRGEETSRIFRPSTTTFDPKATRSAKLRIFAGHSGGQ